MAKPVLLLADSAIGVIGSYLPQPMFDDLLTLGQLAFDQIRGLAARLNGEPGFLTPGRLEELIREFVPDAAGVDAVRRALNSLRPGDLDRVVAELRSIQEANPRYAQSLTAGALTAIESALRELIRDYPSLGRYRKAAQLAVATGCALDGLDLICDLRPVFDSERTTVEGFLPRLVLRMEYRGLTDSRQAVEVALTEAQLGELIKEATKAQRKLETLRQLGDGRLPGEWLTVE